jgi:hypothetical protein
MMSMAELSERVGVNLWKYQAADGQSIRTALDYLTAYLDGKPKWPHGNIAGGVVSPKSSAALSGSASCRRMRRRHEAAASPT